MWDFNITAFIHVCKLSVSYSWSLYSRTFANVCIWMFLRQMCHSVFFIFLCIFDQFILALTTFLNFNENLFHKHWSWSFLGKKCGLSVVWQGMIYRSYTFIPFLVIANSWNFWFTNLDIPVVFACAFYFWFVCAPFHALRHQYILHQLEGQLNPYVANYNPCNQT